MAPLSADTGMLELRAEDLLLAYGRHLALDIPRLSANGRIVAIIGHNGSGKSTCIKSILQLLIPRRGCIEANWVLNGERTALVPEQHMAFSQENGGVFADIKVESYLKLWCRIKHRNGNYYKQYGSHYLEQLDIPPLLGKLGRELSKGQRRRVQAAVGFFTHPKLFLFDEPFDGLDIGQSTQLANIMQSESRRMAMIISSHRMEVVERLADLIIVLRKGRIFTMGTVEEVCRDLCGSSIAVSNSPDQRLELLGLLPSIREEFYTCLVNHIGDRLTVTGSDVTLQALKEFFIRQKIEGIQLNVVKPSLVDAMHYHLNKLMLM